MSQNNTVLWVLRIGVAGEFLGHGVLALMGKPQWIGWLSDLLHISPAVAANVLLIIGGLDVILAVLVLVKPIRPILIWMAAWGFTTALLRPIVGEPIWDFIERFANWAAPLALYLLLPSSRKNTNGSRI